MPLIVNIKVTPSSGKQICKIDKSGILKCFLKSPPEKGKANKELITYLSKKVKIPKNHITILSGETSRNKKLRLETSLSFENLCHALGIELQKTIV